MVNQETTNYITNFKRIRKNNYLEEIKHLTVEKKDPKEVAKEKHPMNKIILNRIACEIRDKVLQLKQITFAHLQKKLTDNASTDYSLWTRTRRIKRTTVSIPLISKEGKCIKSG